MINSHNSGSLLCNLLLLISVEEEVLVFNPVGRSNFLNIYVKLLYTYLAQQK